MASRVRITTGGIKKFLRSRYKYPQAIAEYIWNGFDAQATRIDIDYEESPIRAITSLSVSDNGYGIPRNSLEKKFSPFYESQKSLGEDIDRHNSIQHGKNGVGRLTYFTFAKRATWETVYSDENGNLEYSISVDSEALDHYEASSKEALPTTKKPGTTVSFDGITGLTADKFETDIKRHLLREFAWFLKLNEAKDYEIYINGEKLDYIQLISETADEVIVHQPTDTKFSITFVRWSESLNQEYSRFYYQDSNGDERYKEHTTLNNKGDSFYHSVYIRSQYFNEFDFGMAEGSNQLALATGAKSDEQYRHLKKELAAYLRRKRKPFLKAYSSKLIEEYESEKVFPVFGEELWAQHRERELKDVVRELYQVEPRLFASLNIEQKKTFVRFIDLALESDERTRLFEIIKDVIDLDMEEREELIRILKNSKLSNIIKTISLIRDRFNIVGGLKDLVFDKELFANERDHLQKIVEGHFWLFGEQYNLVTAEEPKFEEALRRYRYILTGENEKTSIADPNRNKEMDIFMTRQSIGYDGSPIIENVILELKSPTVPLGKKELDQVEDYMRTILNTDEFNDTKAKWTFILVGNRLSKGQHEKNAFIQSRIDSYKEKGEPGLALHDDNYNYKIFVKTWSEVFNEFEIRHNFINEKLQLERERIAVESAEEVVDESRTSSAAQNPFVVPSAHKKKRVAVK
jgi:hypothetical protein